MDCEAFFLLYRDLPREGPGSDEATREALRRLPRLPAEPRVLDLGCGPGRQTLVLARELETPIIAVDTHEPYLAQLRQSAASQELADLVITRLGRMEALEEKPGTVDLIWSEGAVYIIGFAEGLRRWRPLLTEDGLVAVTEATWLVDDPPAEVWSWWREEYPAITTVEGNMAKAGGAGFEVFGHFVLPQSAWWDQYYTPLGERVAKLRPEAAGNPGLAKILDETEHEMTMYRRYGDSYGYVFYLMRKSPR